MATGDGGNGKGQTATPTVYDLDNCDSIELLLQGDVNICIFTTFVVEGQRVGLVDSI